MSDKRTPAATSPIFTPSPGGLFKYPYYLDRPLCERCETVPVQELGMIDGESVLDSICAACDQALREEGEEDGEL